MDNDGYGFETKQGKNDDKKVSFTDFEQRAEEESFWILSIRLLIKRNWAAP